MSNVRLFTFYTSDSEVEIYQYPLRIVGDNVHYLSYVKRSSAGSLYHSKYWEIDRYGKVVSETGEDWWPEEDIIPGSKIDKNAKRQLIEFVLEKGIE